jgi:hypothetical protein
LPTISPGGWKRQGRSGKRRSRRIEKAPVCSRMEIASIR